MGGARLMPLVCGAMAVVWLSLPSWAQTGTTAETFKASTYSIEFNLLLPDGQEVKGVEPEGSMIRITSPQGKTYGLTPIIEDQAVRQVQFHVFSIIRAAGGNEAMKELQPKMPGVRLPGITVLQARVIPRPSQPSALTPQANKCVEARCCVTCNGWTACACAVSMGCDSCCCGPCCGIL